MSRIRTIKPEITKDELLGSLPRDVRLFYILLFTLVDDEGRFRAAPPLLRSELFPYDEDLTNNEVEEWVNALATVDRIRLYEVSGQRYGAILRFRKHQVINRPSPSRLPAPPPVSVKPHGRLTETSVSPHCGNGREGNGVTTELLDAGKAKRGTSR